MKRQDIMEKSHKQQLKSEVNKRKVLIQEAKQSDEKINKLQEAIKVRASIKFQCKLNDEIFLQGKRQVAS